MKEYETEPAHPVVKRVLSALSLHPRAALVPEMAAEEYAAFRADVARRGIVVPLEATAAGIVLDGRARLRAACELGYEEVPVRKLAPVVIVVVELQALDHLADEVATKRHLGELGRINLGELDPAIPFLLGAKLGCKKLSDTALTRSPCAEENDVAGSLCRASELGKFRNHVGRPKNDRPRPT